MAVTETPPETVAAASEPALAAPRAEPRGLAAVLGSGDHKVIGRLFIITSLAFGLPMIVLGGLFAVEGTQPATLDVFSRDTVFQFFTLFRVGGVFLLALPLVIGVAMVVVPLQVGARAIAFPRAAAASYWGWLMGSALLVASYLMNGGPGGGRASGVNLWIAALGLITVALLVAAVSLATTVLALRTTGLTLDRTPLFAWSVAVAAILWILTLPVLVGLLVVMYVDHRHGGSSFGSNAGLYGQLAWVLRNPQIYTVAVPVLGFAGDVLATTARTRIAPRFAAQGAIGAFGILGFGAFLAGATGEIYKEWLVIALALVAVLPVLAILGLAGDLFRRGSFRLTAGALYATSALLVLLLGTLSGAVASIPAWSPAGSIADIGVGHAAVLAAVIASLGGVHWWATKIGLQPANEALGRLAPLVLLLGSAAIVIPDVVSGIFGDGPELAPDWTGGIEGLNVVVVVGTVLVLLGILAAAASLLPLLKAGTDVPADPWEGQTLEWLAPSPPPLANFEGDLAVVTSAEPLVDLSEEN
ncbi:cbb3-type cytochrome c oxidase subunit I [Aquihabitans sp. G128]|uniref:cbb3-type cytochrome c oxidase subunit I n=1 Tax=Aquihabitans sp. G128 TaxID=2849779 RepID=UPI001C239959|nr:cbb3-type cytochrome c oxidase subunit I [Aquihabitans sp. G128]QXC59490.1 cbb3-type cytochrome c oxidase subunit I [Aquihabitans sp. G128]